MPEKTEGELLKDKLSYTPKNGCESLDEAVIEAARSFCSGYMGFVDAAKTEREACSYTVAALREAGFAEYKPGTRYKAGDGIYLDNRGKCVYAARLGKKGLGEGARVIAAHIDSPRIDLKQRPLYEEGGFGLFKTHYYGGIKKYQWTTIPLALHGVIYRADGSRADVKIGEEEGEPVFFISDLLPHLGKDQLDKKLGDAFSGEALNLTIGSEKYRDEKVSDKIKLNLLAILHEKYGIIEADLMSAELSAVPSFKARDVGFDRSMVGAYGQDDRVCAYGPLRALIENKEPEHTAVLILADKEEIGSVGTTSMQSRAFEAFFEGLAEAQGASPAEAYRNSKCLSADVNACFDPNFAEAYDAKNAAYANCGVVVTKYTGSRGKSSSSDADAEYMSFIRRLFDGEGVLWQTGELGKVDQGGGGTVAMFLADRNIDTVDVGVPIISMHAPFEVAAKLDIYMMYKAAAAFYK